MLLAWKVLDLPEGPLESRHRPELSHHASALAEDLELVRSRGFAVTHDELEIGLFGVAAPVFGPEATVVASVGVSGPTARLEDRSDHLGQFLKEQTEALSALLRHGTRTRAGRGTDMTPEEILKGLYDETLVGNAPRVLELTYEALSMEMEPQNLLFDALIPSLEEVGARFERGDFFVPEMLIAGRAMAGSMEVLRPLLAETGVETVGKFLMGTVKGDVHDIGKNLVNIMLEGAGFEVIDLGVQVAPETFIAKIEEHQPDIVGFSAFLTTTMPMFKANMNALEKAGLRNEVIVMVGGAPVTQEYADAVGADGYAADASSCVKKAKALMFDRRSKVPA